MKKKFKVILQFYISIILLIFVVGCSSMELFPYSTLLADEEGTYSLLYVSSSPKDTDIKIAPDELLQSGLKTYFDKGALIHSLENGQKAFPKLRIEKVPTIFIFDTKGVVLKTNSIDEAIDFMEKVANR